MPDCCCRGIYCFIWEILRVATRTGGLERNKFVIYPSSVYWFILGVCKTPRCMLTKWGENSLIIYLIHVLFLDVFKTIMISRFGIYWLYWRKWMFPVVILLTALLVQFLSLDIWKRIYDIIFSIPQSIWKKISSSKKS